MSTLPGSRKIPHVSVIIPTQERREFLIQAIASVRAQDYENLDVLVAYGHSTDGTLEYLVSNGIPHTVAERPGIGVARTAGLAATTGEILYFLDDDDLLEPTAVSTLVRALLEADADLAYGTIVNFIDPGYAEETAQGLNDNTAARFSHLGTTITAPINSTTIVRRSAFASFGPMDGDNHSWARWYLAAQDKGLKVIRIDDLLARRRIHATNISRRAGNYDKFFDLIRLRQSEKTDRGDTRS